jgi:hypothetical protein
MRTAAADSSAADGRGGFQLADGRREVTGKDGRVRPPRVGERGRSPVVVGQGTRLFPDNGPDMALDLVESQAFPKGITLQVYWPAGRPQYATD